MEHVIEIVSVPLITALVYGAMALYKFLVNGKEKYIILIPAIAVLLGAALGIIAYFWASDIMPADNVFVAILIGAASGGAATGSHQVFKQLLKNNMEVNGDEENENNP